MERLYTKKLFMKWLITLLVPCCLFLIPVSETGFTSAMRLFLAITVFAVFIMAFDTLPGMVIGLLLPVLYVLSGLAPLNLVFAPWASSTTLFMIIGAFIFGNVLDETGLLKRLIYWALRKTNGSYLGLLFGIALVSMLVTLITSTGGGLLLALLAFGICKELKIEKTIDAAVITFTSAVAMLATLLATYTPLHVGLISAGVATVGMSFELNWIQYLFYNWPFLVWCFIIIFAWSKVFKPTSPNLGIAGKAYFQREYENLGIMTLAEKKAAVIAALLLLFLFTTSIHNIAADWGFIIAPILFYLPGIDIGSETAIKNTNFGMIFFVAACLSIGAVSSFVGIGEFIAQTMVPILAPLGKYPIAVAIYLFGILANLLLSPLAYMSAFSGPIASVAASLGINPTGALLLLLATGDQIIFPYEYPNYLMFFAFGMVTLKDFIKLFSFKLLLGAAFILLLVVPYWILLGMF